MNAIEANEVSLRLGGRALVDRVSLALAPGCLTVVVGPNGAGKSTLLKLLAGELSPSRGEILYDGANVSGLAPYRLACKRAVMGQNTAFAPSFRVYEVVRFGLTGIGRALARREADAMVAASLARADILHLADRDVATLSGGERQRVNFARTLCQLDAGHSSETTQALFLDEPIASLDLEHQLALMTQARRIADRGVSVLAILHDLNFAASFADDLVVMSAGRMVARGTPSAIMTDALIAEVFRVSLCVSAVPAGGAPFVLPQAARLARTGCGQHAEQRQRSGGFDVRHP